LTAFLEVHGLGKRFAQRAGRPPSPWILKDLSFEVADGEFLTIVGPSGSGKTTLLNIIAQTDTATEGAIAFDGQRSSITDATKLDPGLGRRIGYVTQEDNLLPWRTALDNVLFPFELGGRITPEARDRARALMAAVGLTDFETHFPHELSGGMRKRCSLVRTLVYDPPVILMDEPFGAVDAQTRMQLQEDLLTLWSMGRKTIVFVTHDIGEAIALGDRTLVLTRAPTRVAGEHAITIPRPRDVKDIYALPGFPGLYEAIRAQVQ
jgi:NitT/TauT family transport system ATP-binding protein